MITLEKASFEDCVEIHEMQSKSFNELLVKYRDYQTNPAAEKLDVIQNKMKFSDYYFIVFDGKKVGVIRIIPSDNFCRISPIFILPEFHNKGYAQAALKEAELLYPDKRMAS